jgi:hypothetical protein
MKTTINYLVCILMLSVFTTAAVNAQVKSDKQKDQYKQQQPQMQDQQGQREPQKLFDNKLSQRMERDLNERNSQTVNQPISWNDAGYDYYGTYTIDGVDYMARYDKEGKYIETLKRQEWDDKVPADVRSSVEQSPYKSQKVTSYWVVTDPPRKGYYLELTGQNNRVSRVWSDGDGKFSTTPSYVGISPRRQKGMSNKNDTTMNRND